MSEQRRTKVKARDVVSLKAVLDAIPSSWLDSLLTGPDKVIGPQPFHGHDIERLMLAVKQRIESLPRLEP